MSCDPTSLMADAKCVECGIPPGMQLPVLIDLFCQILAKPSPPATQSVQVLWAMTDIPIIGNAQVSILGTGSPGSSKVIPANTLKPGDYIRFDIHGGIDNAGFPQLNLELHFGGATPYSVTTNGLNGQNGAVSQVFILQVKSLGQAGSFTCEGFVGIDFVDLQPAYSTGTFMFDSTIDTTFDVLGTLVGAGFNDSYLSQQVIITLYRAPQ